MECRNCELKQRQFFCTDCVRTHTRDYRVKTQHFAAERDEQVEKSTKALETIQGARGRRASVAQIQGRLDELLSALTRLRKDNDKKRDRLRTLRESHAARRRTLGAANGLPGAPANTTNANSALAAPLAGLSTLSSLITRARAGLVQELVEVFNIVQVGGRPPLGGKAGSQGEWTIGDLILPVPGDVRRYPPQHINAVLGHAVHFVGLLAFYLGVKLPFFVHWEGGKLGVGVPWIGPGRGGWGRWTASHPLHLSLTPSPAPTHSPTTEATPLDLSLSLSQSQSQFLSESTATLRPQTQTSAAAPTPELPQFTTGLAMLLYDVLYLAHTQGVSIPLAQAGDVLGNLWAVCCAPELGRRSHASAAVLYSHLNAHAQQMDAQGHGQNVLSDTRLPPPAPSVFPVDFGQVLQAAASGGGRRAALARHVSVASEDSGKDSGRGSVAGENIAKRDPHKRRDRERPAEEEEGWDIVSEDGY
ncbi:UV radiation resistance protein and autophagy-related subunit 14-domain-containing protein [Mycena alexandri]|uniref:Autophagy-related protein 14 n=1 Tax=Mycena alexandri TaxID=1745969 RepID=A0AAD6SMS0_9AGAR|nr:UV radiation resistance protein and autophagy-related subunit 14-domain-containing protein [Mycena alexandri]